jgi:hypothetical protein
MTLGKFDGADTSLSPRLLLKERKKGGRTECQQPAFINLANKRTLLSFGIGCIYKSLGKPV